RSSDLGVGLAGVGFAALGRGALAGGLARLLALGWGLAALLPGLQRDQRLLGGVLLGRALGAALAGADDLALQHHVRDEARLVLGTRLRVADLRAGEAELLRPLHLDARRV